MTIILTKDVLRHLLITKKLNLLKKHQSDKVSCNYYINPNVSVKIYNPKVLISQDKYMVFEFDKRTSIGLYSLLKMINEELQKLLITENINEETTFYDIFSEIDDDKYTIRCSLPKTRYKYNIKYLYNEEEVSFSLPKKGCIFNEIIIDIRNIWKKDNKIGYNLELKEIKLEIK